MKSIAMIVSVIFLLLLWSDLSRAEYVLVGNLPQAQAEVSSETVSLSALTPQPSSLSTTSVLSYYVSSGPLYTTNPPVYSCVQACALIHGGSASDYHCSTSSSTITYTRNYAEYGWPGCVTMAETYSLGTNYYCGYQACACSAYVQENCYGLNYCWISTVTLAPTPSPTTLKPTAMPSSNFPSYYVSSGPQYTTNPPVYSCVQACALVYGGSVNEFHCSTSSLSLTYTGYYAGYGISGCTLMDETYSLGTNFNCGSTGCAYSAYVQYNCNSQNYCWRSQIPTASPTSIVVTPTPPPTINTHSYYVSSGPLWTSNPPVYSCVQACAQIYGGSSSDYHCSTSSSNITYTGYYAEYGVGGCVVSVETLSLGGGNFNCGVTGCAYSAYVDYNCYSQNYCFAQVSQSSNDDDSSSNPGPISKVTVLIIVFSILGAMAFGAALVYCSYFKKTADDNLSHASDSSA